MGFPFASQAPIRSWPMGRSRRPCNLFASQTVVDQGENRISLRRGVYPAGTSIAILSLYLVTDGNLAPFSSTLHDGSISVSSIRPVTTEFGSADGAVPQQGITGCAAERRSPPASSLRRGPFIRVASRAAILKILFASHASKTCLAFSCRTSLSRTPSGGRNTGSAVVVRTAATSKGVDRPAGTLPPVPHHDCQRLITATIAFFDRPGLPP